MMELFKAQNYAKIRKDHLDMGVPWTDPSFPPSDTSIGHSKSSKLPPVVKWMRPSVSKNNKYIIKYNELIIFLGIM